MKMEQVIAQNHSSKSVPFAKELMTQITVAQTLPHLSYGTLEFFEASKEMVDKT